MADRVTLERDFAADHHCDAPSQDEDNHRNNTEAD
jgi:hypothetical protein